MLSQFFFLCMSPYPISRPVYPGRAMWRILLQGSMSLSEGASSQAWSQGSIRTPCLGTGTFIHRSWGLVWCCCVCMCVGGMVVGGGLHTGCTPIYPCSLSLSMAMQSSHLLWRALCETWAWYGNDMHMYSCDRRLRVPEPTQTTNNWEAAL